MITRNFFLIVLILLGSNLHSQRNYKYENFGNRSILLNGNVTGSVDDLGATYYNPARLALIKGPALLINAKIYEIANIKIANITLDGKDLSSSKFNSVPSMLAGTFKLKSLEGHHFAYSVFSKNYSDFSLGYKGEVEEILDPDPSLALNKYVSGTSINNKLRENWVGISWATSISENFSIGASLFGSDYKHEIGRSEELNIIDDSDNVINYNKLSAIKQESYGLFAKIGAAWQFQKFTLGANMSLPYLEVYGKGKFHFEEFLSGIGNGEDIFTYNDFNNLDSKRKQPFGMAIGAGIPFKKNMLHLDVSYNAPLNNYEKVGIPNLISETEDDIPITTFNEELKSIFNFGVGAEIFTSDFLNFYGSISSDFSPYIYTSTDEPNENIRLTSNYFHYGFGANLSFKWANIIIGTIYSNGSIRYIESSGFPISPVNTPSNDPSKLKSNRWRFIIGFEILFINEDKLKKYGIDKNLF
ncbi:MAG: hypothetical protein KAH07_00525 [Flavobacteriaceae bacterium]|nr:hypothetical protein [Flavobacteriaceae bacterium]